MKHLIVFDKTTKRNETVIDVMTDEKGKLRFKYLGDQSEAWHSEDDTLEAE